MTADNLTFSLEIDYIPDETAGRSEFEAKLKKETEALHGFYTLDKDHRPIAAGLAKDDVDKLLAAAGLSAFGTWPACILTATIASPLPLRAIGMSDGWDIYVGKKTFFAFAQFPADAVNILMKAATYYLDRETYQPLEEFIRETGFENFRNAVLGNESPQPFADDGGYYGSFWGMPDVPPLKAGDFVRPDHNVMQVIEVYPEMGPLLMEYGMSCVGCFVSYDENIWQAAQAHGLDVFEILGEMNEYLADKYHKPLLTKDTPLQDILTLYPQLLAVLEKEGLSMPQDMETTLGALCETAHADADAVIAACDRKLRKED